MILTCGNCGKKIEVSGGLVAGQHVRCPYCDEKTAYDAPTRIGLPTVVDRRDTRHSDPPPPQPQPEPEVAELPQKTVLRIRRPGALTADREHKAAAVDEIEGRIRSHERKVHRRLIRRKVAGLLTWILLLAALGLGLAAWWFWSTGEVSSLIGTNVDVGGNAVERPLETVRTEKVGGEDADEFSSGASRSGTAEKATRVQPVPQSGSTYREHLAKFRNAKLSFWRFLPRNCRPGDGNGIVDVVIAGEGEPYRLFEVVTSDSKMSIRRISGDGIEDGYSESEFIRELSENGGLVLNEGTAYAFRSKRTKTKWSVVEDGTSFNPSQLYLGEVERLVRDLHLNVSEVTYEVRLGFNDGGKPMSVGKVLHGDSIGRAGFIRAAETLAKQMMLAGDSGHPDRRKFVPTVMFHSGVYVSKGANGITMVPRNYMKGDPTPYPKWVELREEAARQERVAARMDVDCRAETLDWELKMNGAVDRRTVDRVLAAGDVTIAVGDTKEDPK